MQKLSSFIFLLAVAGAITVNFRSVAGQYWDDDEICHWQCDSDDCYWEYDYCDYRCYEECYLAGSGLRSSSGAVKGVSSPAFTFFSTLMNPHQMRLLEGGLKQQVAIKTTSPQVATLEPIQEQPSQPNLPKQTKARPKVARMRIMNPTFQTFRNGRLELTKAAPQKGFALFEKSLKQ